ncbi:MAG TPA: hypothetical protein VKY89_24140 [Thermoanaerobaculia bacterium]|nr:hypothetical protein [Thermoanaerobaculia bacterium]
MQQKPSRLRDCLLISIWAASSFLLSSEIAAQQDAARPQAPPPQDIGAAPGHLPKVHYVPSRAPEMTYPLWVDRSLVLNADGTVNTALIHPQGIREIQALRRLPREGGCTLVGPTLQDIINLPPRDNLEEATQSSQLVILGKVTEKAYGVMVDEPGQLLRVEPEEILKGHPREVPAYFVFFPVGTFKLGDLTICKTDNRYPEPPAVGDQVILFSLEWQPLDRHEPYLELEDGEGIVTIHSSGAVSLPRRFHGETTTSVSPSKDDVVARVRAAAKEGH